MRHGEEERMYTDVELVPREHIGGGGVTQGDVEGEGRNGAGLHTILLDSFELTQTLHSAHIATTHTVQYTFIST